MATVCGSNQIDSNLSGLAYAEEECLKLLPGVDGVDAVWRGMEPNSYDTFGADITNTARSPINASRQKKKGSVVDLDASGGLNSDVTKSNMIRLFQGFTFADARELASSAPINGTQIAITAVDDTTGYTAAAGLAVFKAGDIVMASGFGLPVNNGVKIVTAATAIGVVAAGLADEAAPPASAKITCVGKVGVASDLAFSFANGLASLTSTSGAMPFANALPGSWVFIGGDVANSKFVNNVGYARIKTASLQALTFDQTTFNPVTEAGAGKSIQLFMGTVVRNEKDPDLIKRRSYQFERTLGKDAAGTQSEYLIGAVANMFTLNMAQAALLNADLSFIACDKISRTGLEGLKAGVRVDAHGEEAYNTTSDLYRSRLVIHNPTDPNATALFGYVTDASIEINNNAAPSKALGVLGAFDITVGDFEVSGSITAYFTTVEATRAIRNNEDVCWYNIFAAGNAGMIFDIPQLTLGGGSLNVEKDAPITIPIDHNGAESEFGNTLLAQFFEYLPNSAMPKVA